MVVKAVVGLAHLGEVFGNIQEGRVSDILAVEAEDTVVFAIFERLFVGNANGIVLEPQRHFFPA